MRNSLDEEPAKSNVSAEDRERVDKAVKDVVSWLDANQLAEPDEYEFRRKELESLTQEIMARATGNTGGSSCADQAGAAHSEGPTVEEVD
jgi:heat shock protein 1/8